MTNTLLDNIKFTYYNPSMYNSFQKTMEICFQEMGGEYASEEEMQLLHDLYPRGQIVAIDGDTIIGAMISRIVLYETYCKAHTQAQILNLDDYVNDARVGNAVYSMDVFVHPDYRALKLGSVLYSKLLAELVADNFSHLLGASLVSNYSKYAHEMSLKEYIENVKNKTIKDTSLNFHLSQGAVVLDVMENFNPHDKASLGCGVAMAIPMTNYNPNLPTFKDRSIQLEKFSIHE